MNTLFNGQDSSAFVPAINTVECEYQLQAMQFCIKHSVKVSIEFDKQLSQDVTWTGGNEDLRSDRYNVLIECDSHTMEFDFNNSHDASMEGKEPSIYDILACISFCHSTQEGFDYFCDSFGYDRQIECERTYQMIDNPQAKKTYRACKKLNTQLEYLFNQLQLDELAEIA